MIYDYYNSLCVPSCGPETFVKMVPNASISANTSSLPEYVFAINLMDYANIQAYLREMFSTGWDHLLGSTRYNYDDDHIDGSVSVPTAPDVGRELAKAASLSQTIRAITDSMTESIRTNPNSTAQPGLSYVNQDLHRNPMGVPSIPACARADDADRTDCCHHADVAEEDGTVEEFGVGIAVLRVGGMGG